jgi:Tol biopolymer transport system component
MHTPRQTRLIIGLIAAVAAGLPGGAFARAQVPGARTAAQTLNGRIVFQANVGRFPQVFTIAPNGTGLTQVTHVPNKDPGAENPIWSPDGATIAFDAAAGKGVNVFTTSKGTQPAQLPLGVGAFNGDPAYSLDGTQISFDQDTGPAAPTVHGIFIAHADGSDARRLTTGIPTTDAYDTQSQWSPDWSPDGSEILFNTYFDFHAGKFANIYWTRPGGSHPTLLTHTPPVVQSFAPAWSPDGTRIVFDRFTPTKSGGRIDLFTMTAGGTHVHRLTNMPQAFPTNPDWGTAP